MAAEEAARPETSETLERAGLYLHVPFCSKICPYCDFAVTVGGAEKRTRYAHLLARELSLWTDEGWSFDTVYWGGGTPSALAPELLAELFASVEGAGAHGARIFFEANPEDVTRESARRWRELGVATLSLGIQSFDDVELRFLGRRHSGEEALAAVRLARDAGIPTVSIDLIYGLPGQTAASWRKTLDTAIALDPEHLSCYQLTIHEGTSFFVRRERGRLVEAPEPLQAELFDLTHAYLSDAGWPGYEVSNFARSQEYRSRHNTKYWRHVPYLGLGPSAHSFSGLAGSGGRARWWNERELGAWQSRLEVGEKPIAGSEQLSGDDLALEALLLALRTTDGLDLVGFRERYGFDLAEGNAETIERLLGDGQLERRGSRLAPTRRGLAVADSLARAFELRGCERSGL